MKNGLYFILGVIFSLLVFSLENQNENENYNTNTFQTISLKSNSECIIASFNFNIKPIFKEICIFRLKTEKNRYSANLKVENKSESFIQTFRQRNLNIQNNPNTLHIQILYLSDKDDNHKLV